MSGLSNSINISINFNLFNLQGNQFESRFLSIHGEFWSLEQGFNGKSYAGLNWMVYSLLFCQTFWMNLSFAWNSFISTESVKLIQLDHLSWFNSIIWVDSTESYDLYLWIYIAPTKNAVFINTQTGGIEIKVAAAEDTAMRQVRHL